MFQTNGLAETTHAVSTSTLPDSFSIAATSGLIMSLSFVSIDNLANFFSQGITLPLAIHRSSCFLISPSKLMFNENYKQLVEIVIPVELRLIVAGHKVSIPVPSAFILVIIILGG